VADIDAAVQHVKSIDPRKLIDAIYRIDQRGQNRGNPPDFRKVCLFFSELRFCISAMQPPAAAFFNRLGEEVVAFVVRSPSFDVAPEQVIAHLQEQLAPYKYSREVHLVAELPRGPTGKIHKERLVMKALDAAW